MDQASKHIQDLAHDPKFWEGVEHYKDQFSQIEAGAIRAKSVQMFVDKVVKDKFDKAPQMKARIACKQGCAHCCYIMVSVTNDEADLLAKKIKDKEVEVDIERLKIQSQSNSQSGHDYLEKLSYQNRKCVFLDDNNNCKVYQDRPITCRSYFVADSSDGCRTENGSMIALTISNAHEYMVQAAAGLAAGGWQGTGMLSTKLLERL